MKKGPYYWRAKRRRDRRADGLALQREHKELMERMSRSWIRDMELYRLTRPVRPTKPAKKSIIGRIIAWL